MRNMSGNLVAQDHRETATLRYAAEGSIRYSRRGRVSLVWEGLDWIRFEFRKVTVAKSPNPHMLVVLLQTRLPSVSIFSASGSAATLAAIS